MEHLYTTRNKNQTIYLLKDPIHIGEQLLQRNQGSESISTLTSDYELWRTQTAAQIEELFTGSTLAQSFQLASTSAPSQTLGQFKSNLNKALEMALSFLNQLSADVEAGRYEQKDINDIDQPLAFAIIRRLLHNFYRHIEIMYQHPLHSSSQWKEADLAKIQPGSEYDVQRMLYSLVCPIFPKARMEVTEDTVYKLVKHNIVLYEYDSVIKIKYVKEEATEQQLEHELLADLTDFQRDHVFVFVYDPHQRIADVDSFKAALLDRRQATDRKMDIIVNQLA